MLYTLVEVFGPDSASAWDSYVDFRRIRFARFDSIDGILRPSVFHPQTDEDWKHSEIPHYITDRGYAELKLRELGAGEMLGLNFESHDEADPEFRGYDLIDSYWNVSLLTNWGNDVDSINRKIGSNGLMSDLASIREIQEYLFANYGDDSHVEDCRIVSIYGIKKCG